MMKLSMASSAGAKQHPWMILCGVNERYRLRAHKRFQVISLDFFGFYGLMPTVQFNLSLCSPYLPTYNNFFKGCSKLFNMRVSVSWMK